MPNKNNTLKDKLIRLQGKIETIEEVERAKGENFNLFSILGMERLEVQTHSAFIYELINNRGSHNQGDAYLRLFVQNVLKEKGFEYEGVVVKREDCCASKGRINFIPNTIYVNIDCAVRETRSCLHFLQDRVRECEEVDCKISRLY